MKVLYEDEHLMIVNKPYGIKTHPNQPQETDTLLNHVAAYLAEKNQVPYVVHRLDKETSGAIVFAKNPFVLPILGRLLETKQIYRQYQAIVAGHFSQKSRQSISRSVVIDMIAGNDGLILKRIQRLHMSKWSKLFLIIKPQLPVF